MKTLTKLITILFISFLSSPSWSETLTIDDLVKREGLYYKKFTNVPFKGEISGIESGKFKNGKKNGLWEWYYENGQLKGKGNIKNGVMNGSYKSYYENGQLKSKGYWKDNKFSGLSKWYYKSDQLLMKVNFKEGLQHGLLEYFNEDGSIFRTETWKDGELVE